MSVLLLIAAAGCDGRSALDRSAGDSPDARHEVASILVLAAASTADAVEEVARSFEQEHGTRVRLSAGPTNALASQIIAGAPADVFISANPAWANAVHEQGLAAQMRPLLTNTLVLIVPRHNPANVRIPADLLRAEVRKVALAGENVPAGLYAKQALTATSIYERLVGEGRIARGHDVRIALSYVELGDAQAGVVYATDARLSQRVHAVHAFPPASHEPIEYPVVLLRDAANRPPARAFFDYLASPAAERVFEKYGFTMLPDASGRKEPP